MRLLFVMRALFFSVLLGPLMFTPARADQCPGSDTCPENQYAFDQGSNAAEIKWTEPAQLPVEYYVTSNPSAPNQPVQFQTVSPNDWEDRVITGLTPGKSYTFTICAWLSQTNQSCVTTNSIMTSAQSQNGLPTPVITQSSVTPYSISMSWTSSKNYDLYIVSIQGGSIQEPGGNGGSKTWAAQPSTAYQIGVQGCMWAWQNYCSTAALKNVMTPPVPPGAPTNLKATVKSSSEVDLSWTPPPTYSGFEFEIMPPAPGSQTSNFSANGIDWLGLAPYSPYTFQVCTKYNNPPTKLCASVQATTDSLPVIPPGNFRASISSSSVMVLTWTSPGNASSLILTRVPNAASPNPETVPLPVSATQYLDPIPAALFLYTYELCALPAHGPETAQQCVTTAG